MELVTMSHVFRSSRRFTPLNVQNPALPALLGVSANTVQAHLRGDPRRID